jgi:sulfonate transport system permease protein
MAISASVGALFPGPLPVARAALSLCRSGVIFHDWIATLSRVGVGYIAGVTLGTVCGLISGLSPWLGPIMACGFNGIRALPSVSLVFVAIILCGIGEPSKYALIGFATFFPVWVNTHLAVMDLSPELTWVSDMYGARLSQRIRWIVLPAVAGEAISGARTSIAVAFIVCVVAELAAANDGLGFRIEQYYATFVLDRMLAVLIILALTSAALDQLIRVICSRIAPWLNQHNHDR